MKAVKLLGTTHNAPFLVILPVHFLVFSGTVLDNFTATTPEGRVASATDSTTPVVD